MWDDIRWRQSLSHGWWPRETRFASGSLRETSVFFPSSVLTWKEICLTPKLKNLRKQRNYIQIMYTHWSGVTSHKKQTKKQSSHRAARPSYLTAGVHHWLLHDFFSCWLTLTINLGSGRTPEAKPLQQHRIHARTHARTHTHTHTHTLCSVATFNHPSSSHTHSVLTSDGCAKELCRGSAAWRVSVRGCFCKHYSECKWNIESVCVPVCCWLSMKENAVGMSGLSY